MKKKYKKWIGFGLLFIVAAVIAQMYFTLYNLGEATCGESGATFMAWHHPTWDGDRVTIAVGQGGIASGSDIVSYIAPLRAQFKQCIDSYDIVPGESLCEVKVEMITRSDGSGIWEDEYPVPREVPLVGRFVATANISDDDTKYLEASTSGSQPFFYYHDYDCVLISHYPAEQISGGENFLLQGKVYPVEPSIEPDNGGVIDDFVAKYKLQLIALGLIAGAGLFMLFKG